MVKMKTLTVGGQTYTVQDPLAVSFAAQVLTPEQQKQARENVGIEDALLDMLVALWVAPVLLDADTAALADGDGAILVNC